MKLIHYKQASKAQSSEFAGMKEREIIMKKRAEDRLEKSKARVAEADRLEAAEKAKEEEHKKKLIEMALLKAQQRLQK